MKGLKFFSRTNDRHWLNLASYHDPESITWSWILSFGTRKPDEPWIWYFFHAHRGYQGLRWDLCLLSCKLTWQTQSKMLRKPVTSGDRKSKA
jgi:hypothetical protein